MDDELEYVEIHVDEVKAETELAYLFVCEEAETWMPKSQIEDEGFSVGDANIVVSVTKWIAEKKGFDF